MKKINLALLVTVIAVASCKKHTSATLTCTTAIIKYGGNPAADGVGWYLAVGDSTDTKNEYPENIDSLYMINNLAVDVCYEQTDKDFVCFCLPPFKKMVRITSIKKR
jgi:hypothetical protein